MCSGNIVAYTGSPEIGLLRESLNMPSINKQINKYTIHFLSLILLPYKGKGHPITGYQGPRGGVGV
jgi:hypothetical protein